MAKGRKGFEMIWSTWVIMVLAAMLLIFLILFFTMGSGNFLDNIKGYFSKTNVDSVVKGCNILVDSGSKYEYCCSRKDVSYLVNGDVKKGMYTCSQIYEMKLGGNETTTNIKCDDQYCGG